MAAALYQDGAGPLLRLYNGRTGEPFRRLSGHSGTIQSLAFSDDGRLLVSAAEDRTICVWSLIDLEGILGARGGLRGLSLKKEDTRYVVTGVNPSPVDPPLGELHAGDELIGFVDGDQPRVPLSVADFHRTAAARKPGKTVVIRRRDGRQEVRDVTITLGQAEDERKPLFTFFLGGRAHGRERGWLGWHPVGPYDASGPELESSFGWHSNDAGRPDAPASFVLAGQYPEYHRVGLLKDLIKFGKLTDPPPPPPVLRPKMDVYFDEDERGVRGDGGVLVFRQPPARFHLAIVPPERIKAVEWTMDQGLPQPMERAGEDWSVDIPGLARDLQIHTITATVTTDEKVSQQFATSERFCDVPLPQITLKGQDELRKGPLEARLDVPEFRFEATITAAKGFKARRI